MPRLNTGLRILGWRVMVPALIAAWLAACTANNSAMPTAPTAAEQGPPTLPPAPSVTVAVDPDIVQPGSSANITWTASNATACSASGAWTGAQDTANSTGVSTGTLNNPGTYTYSLTCTGAGGSGTASQQVFVGAVSAPTVNLTITPARIQPGDSATLVWSSTNATSCVGAGGAGSAAWAATRVTQNTTGFNTGAVTAAGQYAFELNCSGPGGSLGASQILQVDSSAPPAPPSITFSANPTWLTVGSSTTLTWSAANATSCSATGGTGSDNWQGSRAVSSSGTVVGPLGTAGTYTYTLTCTGNGGTNSQSVSVVASTAATPPPVTVDISVTPGAIVAGGAAVLTWNSTNATACTASGSWGGSQPTTGSAVSTGTVSATGVNSYTLTCTGPTGSASATATLTVNPAPATVSAFAAAPPIVQVGQSSSLVWATLGATSCTAGGGTGADGWTGSEPTLSTGVSVGPFATAGVYTYTLTCTGPGGTGASNSTAVTVTSGATLPLPTISTFLAVPATIQAGQSTTLSWAVVNATSCTASGGTGSDQWTGAEPIGSLGTVIGPLNTPGTYTYTLTCTGAGGTSVPDNVTVTVGAATPAPTIGAFLAVPSSLQVGQSTTLTWATLNATSCAATGGTGADGWSGTTEPPASIGTAIGPFTTAGTYTYTLTCHGPGGASSPLSVTVNVTSGPPPAAITSFTVTPSAVQVGQTVSLAWTTTNATSCTPSAGAGGWATLPIGISSTGTTVLPLTAAGTVTFTLTCTGSGGASTAVNASATVSAGAPPASISGFTANPTAITTGGTTHLSWNAANATSCLGTGGAPLDGWAGTQPVSSTALTVGPITVAGTYTYTLVCTGAGGVSQPATVTVTATAPTPPAAVVGFLATPSTITAGQSTLLSWTSTNATSCTATGGTGSDGWQGAVSIGNLADSVGPLTTAGSYTYTLTCTGPGGTGSASNVTVTVNSPPPGPPLISLTVNGGSTATIQPGGALTLKWSASNATACAAAGGTGTDGWVTASAALSNTADVIAGITVPGIYTYTLTCVGTGGTTSVSVTATVLSSTAGTCGIPNTPTVALLAPTATATGGINGICALGCGVTGLSNVTGSNLSKPAVITIAVGVGATGDVRVTDNSTTYPAGRQTGFLLQNPNALLSLSALQNLTVRTFLNGTLQETATLNNLLSLQALGLLNNPQEGFVGFKTGKSFNAVEVDLGSLASLLGTLDVYGACVSLN